MKIFFYFRTRENSKNYLPNVRTTHSVIYFSEDTEFHFETVSFGNKIINKSVIKAYKYTITLQLDILIFLQKCC